MGVGVTESSYDSDVFMVDTYTTIAVPSGSIISQSPVVTGDTYARAETIADLNSETMEEGDYTVQSRHRYKHFSDPIGPYSSNKVFKQPVKQKKGSFSGVVTSDSCYGCSGYYYSTNFSFRRITVYLQTEAFLRDPRSDYLCVRAYRGYANNAYYPLCRYSPTNRCRNNVILCSFHTPTSFLAVNTIVTSIYGFRFCPRSTYVWSFGQPPCKNVL